MFSVEVLYTDPLAATRARADLMDMKLGASAEDVTVVSDARSYEQKLYLRSTQVIPGAVLGTVFAMAQAAFVLAILWAIPAVTITVGIVGLVFGLAAFYGLIVGGVAGAHSLIRDAARIRDGIVGGRTVLMARYRSPDKAARARSFLVNHPGAAMAATT
jgi:hypothetical protein